MTALYLVLGLIALLFALGWMPLGVDAAYDEAKFTVRIHVGFLRFQVYPARKAEKTEKPAKQKESAAAEEEKPPSRPPNRRQILYTVQTLLPALWRALAALGRRIQISVLRLHVVFGGEDPADVALLYGRAQAAAGAFLPMLERLVRVQRTDVRLSTDYTAEQTAISGEIGLRIRLWALVALVCSMLKHVMAWLRGYRALATEEAAEAADSGGTGGAVCAA